MEDMAQSKYRIAIVLEGDEEECLFDIASSCGGVHPCLDILPYNAGGFGNVAPFFQEFLGDPSFDLVLAVYDVDGRENEENSPYCVVRDQLKSILGEEEAVDAVSFCTNPNILQILLLGCAPLEKVSLTSTSKKTNGEIVSHYWPSIAKKEKEGKNIKTGYDAIRWQLDLIKASYIYEEEPSYQYSALLERSSNMEHDYKHLMPASNVSDLLLALESGDLSFFEAIMERIGN